MQKILYLSISKVCIFPDFRKLLTVCLQICLTISTTLSVSAKTFFGFCQLTMYINWCNMYTLAYCSECSEILAFPFYIHYIRAKYPFFFKLWIQWHIRMVSLFVCVHFYSSQKVKTCLPTNLVRFSSKCLCSV